MQLLSLREFHQELGGRLAESGEVEWVADYGDATAEHAALTQTAGVIDLSFRSRVCLIGADRQSFLNGQVTNNVKDLATSTGCYAALVNAKGKLQSDLNVCNLGDELLLDFEPGLTATVTQRLEKYIIADDVQVVDVAPHYGLWSVQGPQSAAAVERLGLGVALPAKPYQSIKTGDATLGDIYVVNQPRLGSAGFDWYVPVASMGMVGDRLISAVKESGGRLCGFSAWEVARVEAGIPRYGVDMDETNLAPEAGIESRAIQYNKGCYIGQEVIARIRTYGQVAKALRGLVLPAGLPVLPQKGDKLFKDGREVGYVTSAVMSPRFGVPLALGYVRKECHQPGTELRLTTGGQEMPVRVAALPFADGEIRHSRID